MPSAYGIDEHALFDGTSPPPAKTVEHHGVYEAAAEFMRQHRRQPFYLNLWMHETHLAHYPTDESLQENAHFGKPQSIYSAAIADGDKGVGKILDTLRELYLEQNTLVVFSSDNGPENTNRAEELRGGYGGLYSVGNTGGLRGRKRSLYEGGVRLPFIVRWPGHVPAGRVDKSTNVASVDFLPTVCAAASVALPTGIAVDGENMFAALQGQEIRRAKPLFWEWVGSNRPADCWPRWAVRSGDWKLLSDGDSRVELYRLTEDRSEAHNLASTEQQTVERLAGLLNQWRASLPTDPPDEFISKKRAARRAADIE
jgi:N-acetylgalactosamine-6-sulfatase